MRGTVTGKSTATIATMTAVFTNILEVTGNGKRPHMNGFLIALAVSSASHVVILSQSAGSAQSPGPPETATPRSAAPVFAYVSLPPASRAPEAPQLPAPPALTPIPREQKPATGEPSQIPIKTPDERYLRAKILDARPTPIGSLAFNPPKLGVSGNAIEVRLRIFINEYGAVDFVRIEGETPGTEFVDPIIATLKKSRFAPGQVNGENVKSQMVLGWKFVTESNE